MLFNKLKKQNCMQKRLKVSNRGEPLKSISPNKVLARVANEDTQEAMNIHRLLQRIM